MTELSLALALAPASSAACPFSVEMIADESSNHDDGSVANSVQLSIPESSSKLSSLSRQQEEEEEENGPDLVRVDSSENSASSTSSKEDEKEDQEQVQAEVQETPSNSNDNNRVVKKSEDAGMIDCLSDQFSNMFCAAGEPELCLSKQGGTRMVSCEAPCQAFDPADPSTDVFSHLQFWWTPSQEEKLSLKKSPKNRSIRKKNRHVKSLMDTWHPTHSEPLVRSKSILDGHPVVVPQSPTMETACYDSDPEEVFKNQERRQKMRAAVPSPLDTSLGDDRVMCPSPPPAAPTNATRKNFHFASTDRAPLTPSHMDLMSPESDDYVREFVQEVTNSRLDLIWHRYNEPDGDAVSDGLRAPMQVSATFEVGTHLDHKVVQPKLTWNACHSKGPAKKSQLESDWVELLSIIRVIAPQTLNRKLYPFARTDRTLCIVANDHRNPYLVFEAKSREHRDWLVTALKMTVARLASIIIIKDEAMLLEFFSPYAALLSLKEQEREEENEHEDDQEEQEEHTDDEEDLGLQDKDVDLDTNGELSLMAMSPVLFNPKDL
ncbi:MAG: hypothetical protein SGBAC_012511 [Bacillariaceae sp.]